MRRFFRTLPALLALLAAGATPPASGEAIEGRVLDSHGLPVPKIEVVGRPVNPPAGSLWQLSAKSVSDTEGRYRLEGLEPGQYRVWSENGRGANGLQVAVSPGPEASHLDLVVLDGAEVAVRASQPDGSPVPEVLIHLIPVQRESGRDELGISGPDGSFVFPRVLEGDYRLVAEKKGYSDPEPNRELRIVRDEARDLEIRLVPGRFPISGRLLGLDPKEPLAVTIQAEDGDSAAFGKADGQGGYRIEVSAPGSWRVTATTPTGWRAVGSVQVEPGVPGTLLDLDFGPESCHR